MFLRKCWSQWLVSQNIRQAILGHESAFKYEQLQDLAKFKKGFRKNIKIVLEELYALKPDINSQPASDDELDFDEDTPEGYLESLLKTSSIFDSPRSEKSFTLGSPSRCQTKNVEPESSMNLNSGQ